MTELIFKDEVYAIIGAAMNVYNTLGPVFPSRSTRKLFGSKWLIAKFQSKRNKN